MCTLLVIYKFFASAVDIYVDMINRGINELLYSCSLVELQFKLPHLMAEGILLKCYFR
jgi:hypothetical protein